jgi:hypothetical protein
VEEIIAEFPAGVNQKKSFFHTRKENTSCSIDTLFQAMLDLLSIRKEGTARFGYCK